MCFADDMLYSLTGGCRLTTRIDVRALGGLAAERHVPGLLDAQDGQEERAEDELAAQDQGGGRRDDQPQFVLVVEVVEATAAPGGYRHDDAHEARDAKREAEEQAALQRQAFEHPLHAGLLGQKALRAGVDPGEQPEEHRLEADHDHRAGADQRVDVEGDVADGDRAGLDNRSCYQAEQEQEKAGKEEQPARAEQQQEPQVPPAVPPGTQVRRAGPAVLPQRRGDLGDALAPQRGLDDHLAGELHAGGLQAEGEGAVPVEAAQAAVEVADVAREEQPADEREHRVSEVAVQLRHGAWLDAAPEAVPHDQVGALAELGHERHQVGEIVAVVGVAHDDVLAAGGRDTAHEGVAVALLLDGHHARARVGREPLAAIGAAVIGDQNLAVDTGLAKEANSLVHTGRYRLGLIETRHDDG